MERKGWKAALKKEIRDFFQNSGLKIEDYLNRPEKPLSTVLFIMPAIAFTATAVALVLVSTSYTSLRAIFFIVGTIISIWLAINVQIRYKNILSAITIVILAVLLLLVAAGLVAPLDLLDKLRDLRK